jgi:hypothetical protein
MSPPRTAAAAYEALLVRIDDTILELFERIEITADGVDWEREGLRGPSSTWTYLVNDNVFGGNTFLTLANRASFGYMAMAVCWWILIPWMVFSRWRRCDCAGGGPARGERALIQPLDPDHATGSYTGSRPCTLRCNESCRCKDRRGSSAVHRLCSFRISCISL